MKLFHTQSLFDSQNLFCNCLMLMCCDENRDHLSQLLVVLQVNVSPRGRLESRWSVWPRSSIPAIGLAVSVVIWSAESQSSRHNTPSAISQWFSLLKSHLILGPSAASRLTNKLPWLTLSLSLTLLLCYLSLSLTGFYPAFPHWLSSCLFIANYLSILCFHGRVYFPCMYISLSTYGNAVFCIREDFNCQLQICADG